MNIWVIADDRTGNTHQAIALAEKLAKKYMLIKLKYNCLAKLPNFLLKYYPIHIKKEILQDIFNKPLPDIIITAGRRTAALAFYLKMKLKKEIKLVQIMQPNLPYSAFDAVILPYHDLNVIPQLDRLCCMAQKLSQTRHCEQSKTAWQSIKNNKKCYKLAFFNWIASSKLIVFPRNDEKNRAMQQYRQDHGMTKAHNIIPINGAINNVTTKFAAASLELQKHYPELKEFIAVIIGGNNKKFNFDEKEAVFFSSLLKTIHTADTSKVGSQISGEPAERRKLREQRQIPKFDVPNLEVSKVYINQKITFFISFSRRTPDTVKSIIRNNMPPSTIIYDPNKDAGYNPYIAMLAKAKYIISTADSISMCSEAASSGKPLYIFCPASFNSPKHKAFITKLVEQKIARIFDKSVTSLEEYYYPPLDEAERVAKIIKSIINF